MIDHRPDDDDETGGRLFSWCGLDVEVVSVTPDSSTASA
jgi:hypothetical protein